MIRSRSRSPRDYENPALREARRLQALPGGRPTEVGAPSVSTFRGRQHPVVAGQLQLSLDELTVPEESDGAGLELTEAEWDRLLVLLAELLEERGEEFTVSGVLAEALQRLQDEEGAPASRRGGLSLPEAD